MHDPPVRVLHHGQRGGERGPTHLILKDDDSVVTRELGRHYSAERAPWPAVADDAGQCWVPSPDQRHPRLLPSP